MSDPMLHADYADNSLLLLVVLVVVEEVNVL